MAVVPSPSRIDRRRLLAWPKTRLGRRAAIVPVATFLWFVVLGGLAAQRVPDWGGGAQAIVGVAGLVGIAAATSAMVAAVIAITRGERSLALAVPLLFGAFWAIFVVGEFVSPH